MPSRRGDLVRARRLPPNGLTAYRIAQKRGWEGAIGKDAASPYEPGRRRFLKLIQAKEARPLRISLDKNAATLTFVSSGDVKADLQMIDLLLEEASR